MCSNFIPILYACLFVLLHIARNLKNDVFLRPSNDRLGSCSLKRNAIIAHRSLEYTFVTDDYQSFCQHECYNDPECKGYSNWPGLKRCNIYSETAVCPRIGAFTEGPTCQIKNNNFKGAITSGYNPGVEGCFIKQKRKILI